MQHVNCSPSLGSMVSKVFNLHRLKTAHQHAWFAFCLNLLSSCIQNRVTCFLSMFQLPQIVHEFVAVVEL